MGSRVRNLVVGAAVLIAGAVGLLLPVSVWDGTSSTIACGNAVMVDESAPRAANGTPAANVPFHHDFVAECESAISGRRHWAIPLTVVGAAGLLIGLVYRGRRN